MPGAPRFTQKPSIQQTPQGDLLMECHLEADPPPEIVWHHAGTPIPAGPRVTQTLTNLHDILYKAILIIKEPNAGDGGAYKCTASNQLGESNANINLNFAGGGDEQKSAKGPTFLSKPKIIPKDGGALVVLECRVKSSSKPAAVWYKDGVLVKEGAVFNAVSTDLGDSQYLLQLEIHGPSAGDAGQYRCNIKNDQGETNANLALNFEQETEEKREKSPGRKSPRERREKDSASPKSSRPGTPKKQMKSREGTPKKSLKSREGTPRKSVRSRTATPTQEIEKGAADEAEGKAHKTSKAQRLEADGEETQAKTRKISKTEKSEPEEPEAVPKGKPPSGKAEKAEMDTSESKLHKRTERREGEEPEAKTRKASAVSEKSEPEQPELAEAGVKSDQMEVDSQSIKRKSEASLPPPEEKKARQKSRSPPKTDAKGIGLSEEHNVSKAKANYKGAPVVLEAAKSKVARAGETVILECEFQCDRSTKVTWFKDGRAIKPSAEFSTFFDGQLARLTIIQMTEDKSGLFKCAAKSDFGEAHSSAMVKFEHSEDEFDYRKKHRESIAEIEDRLMKEQMAEDEKNAKIEAAKKAEEAKAAAQAKMKAPKAIVTDEQGLRSEPEEAKEGPGAPAAEGDEVSATLIHIAAFQFLYGVFLLCEFIREFISSMRVCLSNIVAVSS
ncbi:unnamed protein product [Toxocara canis]|uniref:Myosin light chain kinase, smooth muscle n=1 Tax=Toxocara canis TaxID=6265 RepID=A0A183UAW1_TOXCA|nr:unnamed protein product [Toxocara canis]